jgi:hypothetical protein
MSIHPSRNEMAARDNYSRFNKYFRFKQFLSHVTIGEEDECWEWEDWCDGDGYGKFHWPEKGTQRANQASYMLFVGSIPKKNGKRLYVCHSCDNPSCVNPKHLWLGTSKQNSEDMVKKHRSDDRRGERNTASVLNEDLVRKLRKKYASGKYTHQKLADKYHVSRKTVGNAVSGKNWKCVETIQ